MWGAAEALGERDSEVLDLTLRQGMTPAEIADVIGTNRNAANQMVHRARTRLKDAVCARVLWRRGRPECGDLADALAAAGVDGFGADAVVHLGKHGSMEWLPGKNAGLSAACATDAAIGNLPLIYPFLVNDPGEGAQAKRRAHATIVDYLIPPMARAESYGDIARLEQLLDEYSNIAAMDPAKLPAIRAQIWTLIQAAKLDHDLGLDGRPHDAEFDDFLLHVDGWLCEVKDAQIRDGLHVLGGAPVGEARVNLVLSILRAAQVWGGKSHAVPGLRAALGLKPDAPLTEVDAVESQARTLVQAMDDGGWVPETASSTVESVLGHTGAEVARVLAFAAEQVVPRLAQTTGFASLDVLDFHRSADVMLVLVIGGTGYLYGGVIGAVVFVLMKDLLSNLTPQYWQFWVGLVLVVIVLLGHERIVRPWHAVVDRFARRANAPAPRAAQ